jgi:uncharacterized protein (UPF0332 family)
MSFSWREYLTLAEALIQARTRFAPAEARYRTAISRAYYAAYCAARNHAALYEGYTPITAGRDHARVAEHYRTGRTPAHHRIAHALRRLLDDRHRADYENDIIDDVRSIARAAVQDARQVFLWLDQLTP